MTTANISGPRQPRYLAGARIVEIYPVLPLIAKVGLGVGVVSNAGVFGIGVTADRDTYPDLDVFVAAARDELRVLDSSTREAVSAAIA